MIRLAARFAARLADDALPGLPVLAAFVLAVPILAVVAAPGVAQETDATGEEAEGAPRVAEDYDAGTVVMTVNGTEITLGQLIALRRNMPEQYQTLPGEVLMEALGEEFSTQVLLADAARAAGIAAREDVQITIQTQTMQILADAYLRDEIAREVDEARVRAEYRTRYRNAPQPEEVRAAHILVKTLEEAEKLKAELDAGEDFAALAARHGSDGTAQRGGDLGWFIHSDMVPEFADAAFALRPGEIGGPVQSPFGFHVIRMDERRTRTAPTLEEAAPGIVRELTASARESVIGRVSADAEIVRADPPLPGDAIKNDALLRR